MKMSFLVELLCLVLCTFLFCEYFVYYLHFSLHCTYPVLDVSGPSLTLLVLSDPHLLGKRKGHWFDKLRREWQMHRAFVSGQTLFGPDQVVILGDLFDEGKWSGDEEFEQTVNRFHSIFPTDKIIVTMGNHDIGFHYMATKHKVQRFAKAFQLDENGVQLLKIPYGDEDDEFVSFVIVNSVAMQDDDCSLCSRAKSKLEVVAKELEKRRVAPIVLQHFPLYRHDDSQCAELDGPFSEYERYRVFKENHDCLSEASSQLLLRKLTPRLVLSGHTHHGCVVHHEGNVAEISVSSFSWRNRDNPAFLLMKVTKDRFEVSKCFVPKESFVINCYITSSIILAVLIIRKMLRRCPVRVTSRFWRSTSLALN